MNNPLVQPDPGLYIWTIVTFLVLLGLLARFAWRPLLDALDRRQASIQKSLDDAREARQELERLHVESRRILDEARTEGAAIISRTRDDAVRFGDEMKKKARADSDAIVKNAQREIDIQASRAVESVRREAIELSVAIATKILRRQVSLEDNQHLVDETVREIESSRPS